MRILKNKNIVVLLLIVMGLSTGCSVISSSLEYGEGTQCLEMGNYSGAIEHLEKAVQLDPSMSRNQNNLASAYLGSGNIQKAWYHSRQAVLCKYCDAVALATFAQLYNFCVKKQNLDLKGTALDEVLCRLGQPDLRREEKEVINLMYGRCVMMFSKGKLVECSFKMLPHELSRR